MVDAPRLLERLDAQLERGYFSIHWLCLDLGVQHGYVLGILSELLDRRLIEQRMTSPYLRITPAGRDLVTVLHSVSPPP